MNVETMNEFAATDKAAVRAELNAQGLGSGWLNHSPEGVVIYLEADSAADFPMMLAAGRIERLVKRNTKVVPVDSLTLAERTSMRGVSIRI